MDKHISVLLNESIDGLNIQKGKIYVDCTVGLGGHSEEILKRLNGEGQLIGFEQDKNAYEIAKERLKKYKNFHLFNNNFIEIEECLRSINISAITGGLILDLGVSSIQLDNETRGFSLKKDGPLDMRMNQNQDLTAEDVINKFSEKDLADIIFTYGEERLSRRIAKAITNNRPINSTKKLSDLIIRCYPRGKRFKTHPATRTFQAIRIFVNNELKVLEKFFLFIPELISSKCRLSVISFHSLEDRIVKEAFKNKEIFNKIIKKPLTPAYSEIRMNPRSRSAKLRIAERI